MHRNMLGRQEIAVLGCDRGVVGRIQKVLDVFRPQALCGVERSA